MPNSHVPLIWTCWFQGEHDEALPHLNKTCLEAWKSLNPNHNLIVIDNDNVDDYAPEYRPIIAELKFERTYTSKSDLLRLLLLKKHGGVWVDASVFPMLPLDFFLPHLLKNNPFFSYRFFPRLAGENADGDREIVSWFLAVASAEHFLMNEWLQRFLVTFLYSDPFPFFSVHQAFADLYDSNPAVRRCLQDMPQLSERIPHCLTHNPLTHVVDPEQAQSMSEGHLHGLLSTNSRIRFSYSFMYKRPMHVTCLQQISQSWAEDFSANRLVSPIAPPFADGVGTFPLRPMLAPLIGRDREAVVQACLQGLCFFDSHHPSQFIKL